MYQNSHADRTEGQANGERAGRALPSSDFGESIRGEALLVMATTLLSCGGGAERSMWEDTSADPNGVHPETNNGGPTTPSSTDPGAPTAAIGAAGGGVCSAGDLTTCYVCTTPRVSRTVDCQGCHKTFHWACMGFYEHKYQKPGPSWRCKECKVVEPTPSDAPEEGEAGSWPAMQPMQPPEPDSGQAIDVGEQAPASTTPPPTVPPVPARTADALAGVPATSVALGTVAGAAGAATAPLAGVAAPAVTVQSPMGEHICPFCRKGLGRKRTLDCSVCHTPWHAVCVNVRGAETPKSWVCRDCKPGAQANAGTSPRNAAAEAVASPSVALETVSSRCWTGTAWIRNSRESWRKSVTSVGYGSIGQQLER